MGPFWTGTKSEFSDSWFHLGRSMKGAEKEAVWFFFHRCNLSLKSPSQIHVTGQFVHSSKQKYHIKPASCWKSSRQQMAKLCIHLEQGHLDPPAFTSLHSSQRPSFLCHIDIQRCPCPLRCWTLCPRDQSNPTDSFASHILSRTKTEHSMTFRPEPIFCCAWSMSLRPSPHCTTDSHRLLCCYSCRVPSVKGEEVQSIFVLLWDQLDVSSNYAAVIWISPWNLFLATVHEQVWFATLALR